MRNRMKWRISHKSRIYKIKLSYVVYEGENGKLIVHAERIG